MPNLLLGQKSYIDTSSISVEVVDMNKTEEEKIKFILERFDENEEWFSDHYEELQEKYENKILAIKEKKVILVDAKVEDLLKNLKAKKEDISSVYIASIPPKGTAFIL